VKEITDLMERSRESQDLDYKTHVKALLQGKTMSVYALLMTRGNMGVRDIARSLGFSSPSLAVHHLTKLVDAELVEKNEHGEYTVTKTVRVGSMSLFVKIGRRLLPRFIFLASLFIIMLVLYFMFFISNPPRGGDLMFLLLCVFGIAFALYESSKIWSIGPL
jgi:hypothetical protein